MREQGQQTWKRQTFNCEDAVVAEPPADSGAALRLGWPFPDVQTLLPHVDGHWRGEASFHPRAVLGESCSCEPGQPMPGTWGKELLGPGGGLGLCTASTARPPPGRLSTSGKQRPCWKCGIVPPAPQEAISCTLTLPLRMALSCLTLWGVILKPPLHRVAGSLLGWVGPILIWGSVSAMVQKHFPRNLPDLLE